MVDELNPNQDFWNEIADEITEGVKMSNKGYQKILDIRRDHMDDNFEVLAIRVDLDTYEDIRTGQEFIMKGGIEFNYEESIGLVAGVEIIPDDSISEPVAEDVRGMWRDRMEEGTITKWGQI